MVSEGSMPEPTSTSPDEQPRHIFATEPLLSRDVPTTTPRTGPHALCPGEYRLAYRAVQAEINPGDMLQIEIYVTGYGEISGAKLAFYPPTYFIKPGNSRLRHGMERGDAKRVGADEEPETVFKLGEH